KFDQLANQMRALSRGGWRALGVLEMLGAVLLVVPAAAQWMPILTPLAAGALALETLALAGLYARYSLKLAATNPMVWAVVMGLLSAFVAYGRYALRPLAAPSLPPRPSGRSEEHTSELQSRFDLVCRLLLEK